MGKHSYQIYQVTNTKNDKIYIGKTRRSAYTRLAEHASGHCPELSSDIAKYGVENFDIKILRDSLAKDDAITMERFHIFNASKKGKDMYNIYCTENKTSHRSKKAKQVTVAVNDKPVRKLFGFDLKRLKRKDTQVLCEDDFKLILKKLKTQDEKYIALELDTHDVILVRKAN